MLGSRQIRTLSGEGWQAEQMDAGMTRGQAEALAMRVRSETAHVVTVEPDDQAFHVIVRRSIGDTWTLYDEQDWDWLRDRIVASEYGRPSACPDVP
jgi:hypothetical protein